MHFEASDIKGLSPAIDPRKSGDQFVMGGRNYVLDALGPKSPFGNRMLSPVPLGDPQYIQSVKLRLRTGDRVFHLTGDGIIEWREDLGNWRFIYVTGETQVIPYSWSWGYLNKIFYFCHPSVGILAYDVDADYCSPLTGAGVPVEPIAICVNNGRLVVMDELAFSWSGPGDGTNWTIELGGAGAQLINDRVPGFPVMVTPYARGVLTWTTGGVMRSEFTGDAAVFRHRALQTEYRPINSFCAFQLDDDTVGILDKRGFFTSQGEAPKPMTPLFNEFLIDYIGKYEVDKGENIRVTWDDLQRRIYLSISLSESAPIYERAFVLYMPLDKWGTFDEAHYGIGPVLIDDSDRSGDYMGFVGSDGVARYWTYVGSRETQPVVGTLDLREPVIQREVHQEIGERTLILSSSFRSHTRGIYGITEGAGFYEPGGNAKYPALLTGLDSFVNIGLIRGRTDLQYDRLIEVTNLFVGSAESGPQTVPSDDWNTVPDGESDEDWNIVAGAEDYGFGNLNYINHGLRVAGTVDGKTEFLAEVPELTRFDANGRHFSCSVTGLWHVIQFSAMATGEYFHVRACELNAVDAGSLN